MSNSLDFATMHFSTEALPVRERVPMLREFVGPIVSRMEIEPLGDGPLHFELAARAVPELAVSTLAFSAVRVERTRALLADGNDNCVLSWLQSPSNTVAHRGKDLRPAEEMARRSRWPTHTSPRQSGWRAASASACHAMC